MGTFLAHAVPARLAHWSGWTLDLVPSQCQPPGRREGETRRCLQYVTALEDSLVAGCGTGL